MANQHFKTIYFPDQKSTGVGGPLTLAFGKGHKDLYKKIQSYSGNELRSILGIESYSDLLRRANEEGLALNTYCLRYLGQHIFVPRRLDSQSPNKEEKIEKFLNKIIEDDCLSVMPRIPSKSIDMILCDLPYGTTQNHWDSTIPIDELWQQYERIIKDDGAIVLTGQGLFTAHLMLSNSKLFKYKITWIKSKPTNFLNAKKQPLRKHEDICVFYKKQPEYSPQMSPGDPYNKGIRKDQLTGSYGDFKAVEVKSNGERYPTDVIYFKTAESEGKVFHPTQKPVDLGRYLIRTFTKPGNLVLDNACGSGSFLVSAVLEGRQFIGIEKNEEVYLHRKEKTDYIKIAKRRVSEAKEQYKSETKNLL